MNGRHQLYSCHRRLSLSASDYGLGQQQSAELAVCERGARGLLHRGIKRKRWPNTAHHNMNIDQGGQFSRGVS